MYLPIRRLGSAHPRPALNAFSFLELLNANTKDPDAGIDLFGVCDFCAEQNIDAVDLTGYFFPGYPNAPDRNYISRIKRHAQHLGIQILGTGVRNDFTAVGSAIRDEGIQRLKTWIEVAAQLGASTVRAFADSQPPFKNWQEASGNANREQVEEWMANALRDCAEYGERFGILVAVQNHGDFLRTGEQHLRLLERVDHPWCAALVDTGQYLTDDPYADIALMAPYAVNWQIKETTQSRMDSPRIDLAKLLKIIFQAGYRGYLPIETLAMGRKDYNPATEVLTLLAELKTAIHDFAWRD